MLLFWPLHGIETASRVSPSLLLLRVRQGVVQRTEGPSGAIRVVGLALREARENQPRFWEMWLRDELYEGDSDDDWRNGEY